MFITVHFLAFGFRSVPIYEDYAKFFSAKLKAFFGTFQSTFAKLHPLIIFHSKLLSLQFVQSFMNKNVAIT